MSIATVKAQLGVVLATANYGGSPAAYPARVEVDPVENVTPADFPMVIITLSNEMENSVEMYANQGEEHYYHLNIYVMLAPFTKPMDEAAVLAEPWPTAIADALWGNLTLNASCARVGDKEDRLFSWRFTPIQWGSEQERYWGLRVRLPIVEHRGVTINA